LSYNPNIPQAGDFTSVTQKQILTNFSNINTQFAFDHVGFLDAVDIDRGKHNKITLPEQSVDPTTAADDNTIYSKVSSGQTDLFSRDESDGTVIKWTNQGVILQALKQEAFVIFDRSGNILKTQDNVEIKNNVSSITKNGSSLIDDWTVNFETNISTDKYFWVLSSVFNVSDNFLNSPFGTTVPFKSATYADSVTAASFRIVTVDLQSALSGNPATVALTQLLNLQIYTVG